MLLSKATIIIIITILENILHIFLVIKYKICYYLIMYCSEWCIIKFSFIIIMLFLVVINNSI